MSTETYPKVSVIKNVYINSLKDGSTNTVSIQNDGFGAPGYDVTTYNKIVAIINSKTPDISSSQYDQYNDKLQIFTSGIPSGNIFIPSSLAGIACPYNDDHYYSIPLIPENPNLTSTVGLGIVGILVNGVAIYSSVDVEEVTFNSSLNRLAPHFELTDFEISDQYYHTSVSNDLDFNDWSTDTFWNGRHASLPHTHSPNKTARLMNLDVGQNADGTTTGLHSSLIGFANDGYPIYGPYCWSGDGTSEIIKLIEPGYSAREESQLQTEAANAGRNFTEYPAGSLKEDYTYEDGKDTDIYNTRFAKTPEFPDGIRYYVATQDSTGEPLYPYVFADSYRGNTGLQQSQDTNVTITTLAEWNNVVANISNYTHINLGNDLGSASAYITSGINNMTINQGIIFNGNGHKIFINISGFGGLFDLEGGTVKNVGVECEPSISVGGYQGWIAKEKAFGEIKGCYSTGQITSYGGGICGQEAGYGGNLIIAKCHSSGSISSYAGGICGRFCALGGNTVTIQDCYSTGVVNNYCGSICGHKSAKAGSTLILKRCYSTGEMKKYCGMTGHKTGKGSSTLKYIDCYSTGNLGEYSGGVVGVDHGWEGTIDVTVSRCYATGTMTQNHCGGVVGTGLCNQNFPSTVLITDCYYLGADNDTSKAGGIVGAYTGNKDASQSFTIRRCFSSTIFSNSQSGGIVGYSIKQGTGTYSILQCVHNDDKLHGGISNGAITSTNNSGTIGDITGTPALLYNTWSSNIWKTNNGTYPTLKSFNNAVRNSGHGSGHIQVDDGTNITHTFTINEGSSPNDFITNLRTLRNSAKSSSKGLYLNYKPRSSVAKHNTARNFEVVSDGDTISTNKDIYMSDEFGSLTIGTSTVSYTGSGIIVDTVPITDTDRVETMIDGVSHKRYYKIGSLESGEAGEDLEKDPKISTTTETTARTVVSTDLTTLKDDIESKLLSTIKGFLR